MVSSGESRRFCSQERAKKEFIKDDIRVLKEKIKERVERFLNEIKDKDSFSLSEKSAIEVLHKKIQENMNTIAQLRSDLREEDLAGEASRVEADSTFKKGVEKELDENLAKLISKSPLVPGTQPSSGTSGSQKNTTVKEYLRDPVPVFDGAVRKFADFKREWRRLVEPGRPSEWILFHLQKSTPEEVDLRPCESVEEAWSTLDRKYGNPTNVSNIVIQSFINHKSTARSEASKFLDLKVQVFRLFGDLRVVGQEKQLANNDHLLNEIIKRIS